MGVHEIIDKQLGMVPGTEQVWELLVLSLGLLKGKLSFQNWLKKKKTLVSNISETETNIWMMDVQKWDWVFHFNRLVMC